MIRITPIILCLLILAPRAYGELELAVSIRPLQLIANSVLGELGSTRLLVPVTGSPHHYAMTPSDRLALESADLIVYVAEELETELHEALTGLGSNRQILAVGEQPTISKRNLNGSDSFDPHIWLDSRNGLQIAQVIRDRLVAIDGSLEQALDQNLSILAAQLEELEAQWLSQMSALPPVSYAVYHDAIGYFEAQFDQRYSVGLVDDPEVAPGIRHITEVRRHIIEQKPLCLFVDLTARQTTIDTLFSNQPVRQVKLDLMGEGLSSDQGYPQLMNNLVNQFSQCLINEARQ